MQHYGNFPFRYERVLLKLSGEMLAGKKGSVFDTNAIEQFSKEVVEVSQIGIEIGIVVGGGNIFRGIKAESIGFERVTSDYMGMLATLINCLALKQQIKKFGACAKVFSAISIDGVIEKYNQELVKKFLKEKYILFFACGTGNPFFTTDTAAALRALEIHADILIKGTKVDGVYDNDPNLVPDARKYDTITYKEALEKKLGIMDATAFSLCMENDLEIRVINLNKEGNIKKVLLGEPIGTVIKGDLI